MRRGEISSWTEGRGIEGGRGFPLRGRIRESIFIRIFFLVVNLEREVRSARSGRSGKGGGFGNSLLIDFVRVASDLCVD